MTLELRDGMRHASFGAIWTAIDRQVGQLSVLYKNVVGPKFGRRLRLWERCGVIDCRGEKDREAVEVRRGGPFQRNAGGSAAATAN